MLRAPFELRTWKETLHLLLNMPVGIATFTIVVTGLALGFGSRSRLHSNTTV